MHLIGRVMDKEIAETAPMEDRIMVAMGSKVQYVNAT